MIIFVSSWVSLFGAVLFAWRSLTCLTGDEKYSRWASLLVIYMAYFQFPLAYGLNFLLPYDLPSLFFFSGCVFCVISQRMRLFYLFFIVGCFNRETIFMTMPFLLLWRSHELRNRESLLLSVGHAFSQAVLFMAVRLYLRHLFSGNIPDTVDATLYYKLAYNLRAIAEPRQWPVLFSVFGFTVPLVFVWRGWMKNRAMERGIYLMILWFLVMMLVGLVIEIRVFSELISYAALAVALIFFNRFPGLQSLSRSERSVS